MAIDLYAGKPRSGKSYSVTEHVIIPSLKEGRHVITNIPLEREQLLADYPAGQITQVQKGWENEPDWADGIPNGAVLIMDECWRRWKSGQKVTQANPKDLELFKEHGHRVDDDGKTLRVVLVTQFASDLPSWLREMVDQMYFSTKLAAAGAKNRFRVDIYEGAPTGAKIPQNLLIRSTFGSYKPEIYKYYRSATQSSTGDVGDESKADKRGNIWRSPMTWVYLAGAPIAIMIALYCLNNIYAKNTNAISQAKQEAPVNPLPANLQHVEPKPVQTQQVVQQVQVNPSAPQPSQMWRVVGYIKRGKGYDYRGTDSRVEGPMMEDQIILSHSLGGTRYVPASTCTAYSDHINYYCDIEGERITPWTDKLGISKNLPVTAGQAVQSVSSERSDQRTDAQPVSPSQAFNNPLPPQTGV